MNTIILNTSISCGGCIAKVTSTLNSLVGEGNWEVNTSLPLKPLTVKSTNTSVEEIIDALKKIGFKAELAR